MSNRWLVYRFESSVMPAICLTETEIEELYPGNSIRCCELPVKLINSLSYSPPSGGVFSVVGEPAARASARRSDSFRRFLTSALGSEENRFVLKNNGPSMC
jgi:hypothetical protein